MKDLRHIIRHVRTDVLKAPNRSNKKHSQVELYRLDFSKTKLPLEDFPEAINYELDENGAVSKRHPNFHLAHSYSLPPQYEKMVDEALFAIPPRAMKTINFLLLEAVTHWENPFYDSFDTAISEGLLKVSKTFIERAFFLMFDYIYDPETQYYRRNENHELDKDTLKDLCLYTFWRGRTGCGLQAYNANMYGNSNKKDKYDNEDLFDRRDRNKSMYYLYKEIREYEKFQSDYVKELDIKLNNRDLRVNEEPSIGEIKKYGPGIDGIDNDLNLYEIHISGSEEAIKDGEIIAVGGSGSSLKVVAKNKHEAIVMAKNFWYNKNESVFSEDTYCSYRFKANDLEMDGLKPEKEGVVITIKYEEEEM